MTDNIHVRTCVSVGPSWPHFFLKYWYPGPRNSLPQEAPCQGAWEGVEPKISHPKNFRKRWSKWRGKWV